MNVANKDLQNKGRCLNLPVPSHPGWNLIMCRKLIVYSPILVTKNIVFVE